MTALNVFAPDGLVARQTSSSTTEYVLDQQGNVADRTDTSGTVQSVTQYDAWGNEQAISGTPTDPFGFNGQSGYYLDRETGIYLCQHRFYDPAAGGLDEARRLLHRRAQSGHPGALKADTWARAKRRVAWTKPEDFE